MGKLGAWEEVEIRAGSIRGYCCMRFKEVLKTEGEAQGFQHFPADIKSVTRG